MAIFDNCILQAPDGVNLSRCGIKKANWYVNKGLGSVVSEDPFIVRLSFEPRGRNGVDDPLLMEGKPNICVVCGTTENLTRHHIVPYSFIRHMRVEYKVDIIRDIYPLCEDCHGRYEALSNDKRQEIAARLGVQLYGLPEEEYQRLRKAKGAAFALQKYADKMPSERTVELKKVVQDYWDKEQITEEDLLSLDEVELENHNGYINVMKEVAGRVTDYSEFAREWREHFVTHMQPKYMPETWSVDRKTNPENIWIPKRMLLQDHEAASSKRR